VIEQRKEKKRKEKKKGNTIERNNRITAQHSTQGIP